MNDLFDTRQSFSAEYTWQYYVHVPYTGWRHTNVRAISNHVSHKNGAEHFSAIFLGSFGDKQATAEFPDEKKFDDRSNIW